MSTITDDRPTAIAACPRPNLRRGVKSPAFCGQSDPATVTPSATSESVFKRVERYQPRDALKHSTAKSTSSVVWAADSCVRIRALPRGTTG